MNFVDRLDRKRIFKNINNSSKIDFMFG